MRGSVLAWGKSWRKERQPCIHSLLFLLKRWLPLVAVCSSSCFPGGTPLLIDWDGAVNRIDCIPGKLHFEREPEGEIYAKIQ